MTIYKRLKISDWMLVFNKWLPNEKYGTLEQDSFMARLWIAVISSHRPNCSLKSVARKKEDSFPFYVKYRGAKFSIFFSLPIAVEEKNLLFLAKMHNQYRKVPPRAKNNIYLVKSLKVYRERSDANHKQYKWNWHFYAISYNQKNTREFFNCCGKS